MHNLVKKERGKASEHNCVDCGEQAREWSQSKGNDGMSIWNYFPRCKRCHSIYDMPK